MLDTFRGLIICYILTGTLNPKYSIFVFFLKSNLFFLFYLFKILLVVFLRVLLFDAFGLGIHLLSGFHSLA